MIDRRTTSRMHTRAGSTGWRARLQTRARAGSRSTRRQSSCTASYSACETWSTSSRQGGSPRELPPQTRGLTSAEYRQRGRSVPLALDVVVQAALPPHADRLPLCPSLLPTADLSASAPPTNLHRPVQRVDCPQPARARRHGEGRQGDRQYGVPKSGGKVVAGCVTVCGQRGNTASMNSVRKRRVSTEKPCLLHPLRPLRREAPQLHIRP